MAGTVLFLIAAALAAACGAVRVILPPTDMARVVGSNVTLACVVSDRQPLESVQWKHQPVNSDAINALTFNENVLSSHAKYSVVWTYNLTVANLTHADAGLYRCTAGGRDHDAILTVVDLPANVTVDMSGEAFIGERHNLTCHASSSFPPPEVTWLVNGVDMTTVAITESTLPTVDGYGEVWSYLTLDLDKSMNGRLAECVLSYRGWDNAVRATFTIQTLYRGGYANSGTVFDNPGAILFPGASSLTSGTESSSSGQGYGANRTATGSRGMFLIRFLKQSATENINWELQQFQP